MSKSKGCTPNEVRDFIQTFVPKARLESNTAGELSFTLPHDGVKR